MSESMRHAIAEAERCLADAEDMLHTAQGRIDDARWQLLQATLPDRKPDSSLKPDALDTALKETYSKKAQFEAQESVRRMEGKR